MHDSTMAQSTTSAEGKTFALRSCITFGTLDFFATAIGELNLAAPDVSSNMGTQPARSTRSKAEKRRFRRHVVALKRCLNRHQNEGGGSPIFDYGRSHRTPTNIRPRLA